MIVNDLLLPLETESINDSSSYTFENRVHNSFDNNKIIKIHFEYLYSFHKRSNLYRQVFEQNEFLMKTELSDKVCFCIHIMFRILISWKEINKMTSQNINFKIWALDIEILVNLSLQSKEGFRKTFLASIQYLQLYLFKKKWKKMTSASTNFNIWDLLVP